VSASNVHPPGIIPRIALRGDAVIPQLGFGVFQVPPGETAAVVARALSVGYRHIDTAAAYGNEAGVGEAVRGSGLGREEVFVTSKCANKDHGYEEAKRAFHATLRRLRFDYLDLYLIHWPAPQLGKYVDSFGGLIQLRANDYVRSIGVCNFTEEHLETVIDLSFVTPAVNQIELHPLLNQDELRAANAAHNVVTEAYSPLAVGRLLDNPTVASIAAEYSRTPAQVLIRWSLQLGNVVIPRSAKPERIANNIDVFDFELAAEHMDALNGLNDGTRVREDPLTYTGI